MHPPSSAPEIADGNIPIHTINTVCEEPEAESIYLPTTVPWDHGVSPEEKNRWQSKLNKGNTEPIPPITVVQSIINSRPLYNLPASHWDTLRKMHDPLECIKVRYSQLKTIWIYINRENSVDDHRGSSHFRLNDSNGNYIGSSFKHGKNFNYVYSTIRQWHDAFAKIGITKEEIDKYYGKSQSGPVLK
ncbi:MAG: hypothetical protein IPP74_01015 [Alphaproteobacteria bacterium]|nr:hypothetical protein [Alphaproteobacteria bacterium]